MEKRILLFKVEEIFVISILDENKKYIYFTFKNEPFERDNLSGLIEKIKANENIKDYTHYDYFGVDQTIEDSRLKKIPKILQFSDQQIVRFSFNISELTEIISQTERKITLPEIDAYMHSSWKRFNELIKKMKE